MSSDLFGHEKFSFSGQVVDENRQPMVGVHVHLSKQIVASDIDGRFSFKNLEPGKYAFTCNFIGYRSFSTDIFLKRDTIVTIQMVPETINLKEITIVEKKTGEALSLKIQSLEAAAIMNRYSGSFIKSIESVPGVNAMDIGASMSKPIIRGLGFNRIVVAENGIKQEGQQWGADHGLEIDPFNVEKASVIKGAASLEYGSDAIGGVINIVNSKLPEQYSFSGDISLLAKSVNQTLGTSAFVQYRGNRYYFKLRGTLLDYGDYKVPTDRIRYLETQIPLYNNRLKNTAGQEKDVYVVGGYLSDQFRSSLSLSVVNQLNGFFPGAHGVPKIDRVADDGDRRNIDFPYQNSNHFKAISNSVWILGDQDFHLDLGFQQNRRQEWSKFHTHFLGQLPSDVNPDLELDFLLKTLSVNAKYHFHISNHNLTIGTQNQVQYNTIDGYNFFLPKYSRFSTGLFVKDELEINKKTRITMGGRYDWGYNTIDGYYDSILYRDLVRRGVEDLADFYAQRSIASSKKDGNVSWLWGLVHQLNKNWTSRINIGKSFRMPLPIEMGANGIHHGSFRHELGNTSLKSEIGYYLDGAVEHETSNFNFIINPYIYYFPNYIFLNPTGNWSYLAHAGQIYEFDQSKAVLAGVEVEASKKFGAGFLISGNLEYLYNRQLSGESKHYAMPFTPPINGFAEIEYAFGKPLNGEKPYHVFLNGKWALEQNQLAKNEESTPGYQIYGTGVRSSLRFGKNHFHISLMAQNIFNTKYFSHLSFYRKLEIPEPGRNIQLLLKIPLSK